MKRAVIVALILLPLAISAQEPVIEPRPQPSVTTVWTEHILLSSEVVLQPGDDWISETLDVSQVSEILIRATATVGDMRCEPRWLWSDTDADFQSGGFTWHTGTRDGRFLNGAKYPSRANWSN